MNNHVKVIMLVIVLSFSGLYSMDNKVMDLFKHPQAIDIWSGLVVGPMARLFGRVVYQNVSVADQPIALAAMSVIVALGAGARFVQGNSNVPLHLLVSLFSAAATLTRWPITQKSEAAEKINQADKVRDATIAAPTVIPS